MKNEEKTRKRIKALADLDKRAKNTAK